jgi:hypothetical protein
MDAEAVKYLVGQGGFAVAFLLLFHFYRKDVKGYTDLWRGQSEALIGVVKENTASNIHLITLIDALHRRLDTDAMNGLHGGPSRRAP